MLQPPSSLAFHLLPRVKVLALATEGEAGATRLATPLTHRRHIVRRGDTVMLAVQLALPERLCVRVF